MLRANRQRNHHHHPNPRLNLERPSSSSATAAAIQPEKPTAKLLSVLFQALITALILYLCCAFAAGVAIIALLHLCLLGGALRRRCSRRHNHHYLLDSDDPAPRLSPARFKKLPTKRFTPKSELAQGSEDDDELCVICLEDFSDGEWCRELPDCKHVFHVDCVDAWLVKALVCPFCRTAVSLHGGDGEEIPAEVISSL